LESVVRTFVARVGEELHRAERYRIFIALTILDLNPVADLIAGSSEPEVLSDLEQTVSQSIRSCDYVSFVDNRCLGLLFPETSRQGAEVAIKRVTQLIQDELSRLTSRPVKQVIPAELASYPDAAGTRTISQFLEDFQHKSRN